MYKPTDRQMPLLSTDKRISPEARKRLEGSWAAGFREHVYPVLLRQEAEFSDLYPDNGRPNWSVARFLGVLVLQEMLNLPDQAALDALSFDVRWQYAIDLSGDDAYLSRRSLVAFRSRLVQADPEMTRMRRVFEEIGEAAIRGLGVTVRHQRIDSTHVTSNIRTRGRVDLFTRTLVRFVRFLKQSHPSLVTGLPEALDAWYTAREGHEGWDDVGPTSSLIELAGWLHWIKIRYADTEVAESEPYELVVRLFSEHCVVEDDDGGGDNSSGDGDSRIRLTKPNRPGTSLQSPYDPDAGFSSKKGVGYSVQVVETCRNRKDGPPEIITDFEVHSAGKRDFGQTIPSLERLEAAGRLPEVLIGDSHYSSGDLRREWSVRGFGPGFCRWSGDEEGAIEARIPRQPAAAACTGVALMARFVPVPYAALDVASDDREEFAVFDLWRRGHKRRWKPFRISEREVCRKWGLGNRRVWALLEELGRDGLVTFEKGTHRKQSVITVLSPTKEPDPDQQQGQQHCDEGSKVDTNDPAAPSTALNPNSRVSSAGEQQGQQQGQQHCDKGSTGNIDELAALDAAQDAAQANSTGCSTHVDLRPETERKTETREYVCALAEVWANAWLEHRGAEVSWSPRRDEYLRTFGDLCGWDAQLFAAAAAEYQAAEARGVWPQRPASLGKAAYNAADWVNKARAVVAARARAEASKPLPVVAPPPNLHAAARWAELLDGVQGISRRDVNIWLRKAVPIDLDDSTITVWFENRDYVDWVTENYLDFLQDGVLTVVCITEQPGRAAQ